MRQPSECTRNGDAHEFFRARDFLLAHRADYNLAYDAFTWPTLHEFNWAIDYFDRDRRR
jgi:acetyl-CoA synthetase